MGVPPGHFGHPESSSYSTLPTPKKNKQTTKTTFYHDGSMANHLRKVLLFHNLEVLSCDMRGTAILTQKTEQRWKHKAQHMWVIKHVFPTCWLGQLWHHSLTLRECISILVVLNGSSICFCFIIIVAVADLPDIPYKKSPKNKSWKDGALVEDPGKRRTGGPKNCLVVSGCRPNNHHPSCPAKVGGSWLRWLDIIPICLSNLSCVIFDNLGPNLRPHANRTSWLTPHQFHPFSRWYTNVCSLSGFVSWLWLRPWNHICTMFLQWVN